MDIILSFVDIYPIEQEENHVSSLYIDILLIEEITYGRLQVREPFLYCYMSTHLVYSSMHIFTHLCIYVIFVNLCKWPVVYLIVVVHKTECNIRRNLHSQGNFIVTLKHTNVSRLFIWRRLSEYHVHACSLLHVQPDWLWWNVKMKWGREHRVLWIYISLDIIFEILSFIMFEQGWNGWDI